MTSVIESRRDAHVAADAKPVAGVRPPRVLHVIENLDRQAVENWLIRMMRHAAQRGAALDWTFYCTMGRPGIMDDTVRGLGGRIVYSPCSISEPVRFVRALRATLRAGAYDVFHCHHDIMSAPELLSALGLPIRKTIVHVHNADLNLPTPSHWKRRLFREPFRQICLRADRVVGISHHTLRTMLDGRPVDAARHCIHYYGVDPSPFQRRGDPAAFRRALGLPADAKILLFAGRIAPEKNPLFAIDVFAALRRRDADTVIVFAGAGGLEEAVLRRAQQLHVDPWLKMLGWRSDLAEVMGCCDWFILPRPEQPMEGFGLAVIEAQLAGLRLLLSRGIADDPLLPTARFRRLSLSESAEAWADAAMHLIAEPAPSTAEALQALKDSPMDMDFALRDLLRLHERGTGRLNAGYVAQQ
jgi:glycosyltransferase involved in cell wall biosynthesis